MMFKRHILIRAANLFSLLITTVNVSRIQPFKDQDTSGFENNVHNNATRKHTIDTTIIISSSLIPTHPSLKIMDKTIESLGYLNGLPDTSPIVITVDGLDPRDRDSPKTLRLFQYVEALKKKYNRPHIRVFLQQKKVHLVGNIQQAMGIVNTEFVYLIQHDMPFIATVDHSGLIQTFHSHPNEVRLVRFSPRKTLVRNRDQLGLCGNNVEFHANGVELSKTHTWSDQNHFTRKSYYDEMFSDIPGWEEVRFMEKKMQDLGIQNCSYWGTYLYGRKQYGSPMVIHMDGRRETDTTHIS